MKIYDITVPLPQAPVFPGDPQTHVERVLNIKDGSMCNLSEISMCLHAGTHADAPLHFIDGAPSIDMLDPALFVGPVRVITADTKEPLVCAADLEPFKLQSGERVIVRTRNTLDGHTTDPEFYTDYCALSPDAARHIAERGVTLVGIDYASIGGGETIAETHRILLSARVAVLERLDLRAVPDGAYFLSAAPLKISGADGAPVRAILIDFNA